MEVAGAAQETGGPFPEMLPFLALPLLRNSSGDKAREGFRHSSHLPRMCPIPALVIPHCSCLGPRLSTVWSHSKSGAELGAVLPPL